MKVKIALVGVVGVALLSSCASTPKPRTDIGMARVGLSQAFTDTKLEPLPPEIIVRLVPALTPEVVANYPNFPATPITLPPTCPKADSDATVPGTAPLVIVGTPKPGFYKRHNVGTIKITTGPLSAAFPYPFNTYEEVRDVKRVETSPLPAVSSMMKTQFTVISNITPTYKIEDTYQYDTSTMDLVHHEETNNGVVLNDDWVPPVEVFGMTGLGKRWQDIGASTSSRRVFTITGNTPQKKVVDMCGSLIETVLAQTTTTIADLTHRTTSGTTTGKKDFAAIATSAGGIAAYRETHTTEIATVNNVPVTIQIDVASTLDSITPLAQRPA